MIDHTWSRAEGDGSYFRPRMESKLLARLRQPAYDVFVTIQDARLRPDEVFRMCLENINLSERAYFNAWGKASRSRGWVALSQRVLDLLFMR